MNIFDVILGYIPMLLPHDLPQLKPNLFLKADELIHEQVSIPVSDNPIYLCPRPEFLCGYIFSLAKSPMVSRKIIHLFLAFRQDLLIFIKRRTPKEVLHVINPFINIQRRGDL